MSLSFDYYRPTPLESAVNQFFEKKKVYSPYEIDLELIAEDGNITIHYQPLSSITYQFHTFYSIIIDNRLPIRQQKVELAHELGHALLHVGRQDFMKDDLRAMQEWQADRFSMYYLTPTHMIKEHLIATNSREQLVHHLSDVFDIPETFMDARLHLLENRMRALASEAHMSDRLNQMRATYDYSYRHPTNPTIEYLVKDGAIIGRQRRAEI